jgi:hypothetical protein
VTGETPGFRIPVVQDGDAWVIDPERREPPLTDNRFLSLREAINDAARRRYGE